MSRVVIYASKKDLTALEDIASACDYLSRRLYEEFGLSIGVRRENLVYCYPHESPRTIREKIFYSKKYEEKPQTKKKPTAIVVLHTNKTLEQLAKHEKIPFLQTSVDEITENLA